MARLQFFEKKCQAIRKLCATGNNTCLAQAICSSFNIATQSILHPSILNLVSYRKIVYAFEMFAIFLLDVVSKTAMVNKDVHYVRVINGFSEPFRDLN